MSKAMYGKSMMKKSGTKKYQPGGPVTEAPVPPVPNSYAEQQPMKMVNQRVPMTKSQTPSNFNKVVGGADFVKRGGAIKPTYKKVGTTKMKMKKMGVGGPTNNTNSTPTESISQPNTPPTGTNKLTGNPRLKNGGAKKTVKKPIKKAKYGMSMKGKKSC